ncbi:hypothetical protein GCM10022200_29990 [Microbacterium awajiense]|uniref:TadE-like protein n=1 Tax=Microbacterium awajiense TaxID=415214 RepID=A0ABP7B076_9MICO
MRIVRRGVRIGDGDGGSVTAELVIALPVAALTMALGVGALGAAARAVLLQDAAADAARLIARGEPPARADAAVAAAIEGASVTVEHRDELVCVRASASTGFALLPRTSATACALDGGL